MTELQLKIRKLAHKASTLKKAGKDTAAVLAELTPLREQRKAERAAEKAAKAAEKGAKAEKTETAEAPAQA